MKYLFNAVADIKMPWARRKDQMNRQSQLISKNSTTIGHLQSEINLLKEKTVSLEQMITSNRVFLNKSVWDLSKRLDDSMVHSGALVKSLARRLNELEKRSVNEKDI